MKMDKFNRLKMMLLQLLSLQICLSISLTKEILLSGVIFANIPTEMKRSAESRVLFMARLQAKNMLTYSVCYGIAMSFWTKNCTYVE